MDLKGAFDKANGEIILHELVSMGVSGRLLPWIRDYLHGRRAKVSYQGAISEEAEFHLGTPQGGVISPMLFNVLMNRVASQELAAGVRTIIYADDIMLQSKSVENMQKALNTFGELSRKLGLIINENKINFSAEQKVINK